MGTDPAWRARGRNDDGVAPTCGQLLQRYRSLAGLTQEGLAEKAGYSADYIGKLERDQRELPAAALDRLADVLGLADQERAALAAARGKQTSGRLLVGRDAELTEIRGHLAGLGPPVLLLAAEPGMGKTRLLEAAVSGAARSGWGIARGACQRRALDPYAPLSGALSDALDRMPDRDRAEVLGQAGDLDLLLPELASVGQGRTRVPTRPEQLWRLLFSATAQCLRAAAGQAGTLLVLDDLHWAGPDALDLLAALLMVPGSPPIRLIGAYRNSETSPRLEEFIADLARASLIRMLGLGPLSDADAEQFLIHLAPRRPATSAALSAIVRRAGGVPFFLASYADDVRFDSEGAPASMVPWTVAKVIRQRVLALPGAVQEHLDVAAVIGRVVPQRLLALVTGSSDEEVLHAAEAAMRARLLAEDGAVPAGYCFTHDLIRETIEHGLSAGRRRLLHRRIGEALEREPGAPAESLAFHFGLSDDDGKATAYLELAGEQAQDRIAYATAADYFAQAAGRLELAGRQAAAVPVSEKQGVALHRAGRHREAISVLELALAGYQRAGDEDGAHRVTGQLADAHFRQGTSVDLLAELADLDLVQDPGSQSAMTRWHGLFRLLFAQGSYQQMVTVGRSLAQEGRTAGNGELAAFGAGVQGAGLIRQGRLVEGTALLEQAVASDRAQGDIWRTADAGAMLSGVYLRMGRIEPCQALSARMLRAAGTAGDEVVAAMHTLLLGAASYARGDWPHGQDLIRKVKQRFAAGDPSPLAVRMVPALAMVLTWQGAWEDARSYLKTSLQTARAMGVANVEGTALAHLAELDVLQGRPQDAITRLRPYLTSELAWDYATTLWSALAAAHLELEDPQQAQAAAGQAVAAARRSGAWLYGIRALEVQGIVHVGCGELDLAQAAFQEGLERARAMPFPYGQAHLLHAQGLLDRQRRDEAAARASFAEALAIAERLGAKRDAVRFREQLEPTPRSG
jgi:transcriptional regulator with XRE-family HTH domain/tetratricopeptide (TPR) repeat protein